MAFCSVTFSFSDCLHCPSVYEATTISSSVTMDSSSSVFSASTDFSEAESASFWVVSLVSPPVLLFQALQAGLSLCSNHGCWRHSSAVARSLQRKKSVKISVQMNLKSSTLQKRSIQGYDCIKTRQIEVKKKHWYLSFAKKDQQQPKEMNC